MKIHGRLQKMLKKSAASLTAMSKWTTNFKLLRTNVADDHLSENTGNRTTDKQWANAARRLQ